MLVQNVSERDSVLGVVWLSASAQAELNKYVDGSFTALLECNVLPRCRTPLPLGLPWSQSFYLCCQDVGTPFHVLFICTHSVTDPEFHPEILPIRRGCLTAPSEHRRALEQGLPTTNVTIVLYLQFPFSRWIPSSQAMSAKASASV
jgi:hypothetical protein